MNRIIVRRRESSLPFHISALIKSAVSVDPRPDHDDATPEGERAPRRFALTPDLARFAWEPTFQRVLDYHHRCSFIGQRINLLARGGDL